MAITDLLLLFSRNSLININTLSISDSFLEPLFVTVLPTNIKSGFEISNFLQSVRLLL